MPAPYVNAEVPAKNENSPGHHENIAYAGSSEHPVGRHHNAMMSSSSTAAATHSVTPGSITMNYFQYWQ